MDLKETISGCYEPTLFKGENFVYPTNTPESNNYGTITRPYPINMKAQLVFLTFGSDPSQVGPNTYYTQDLFIDRAGGTSFATWTYGFDTVPQ